jgi:hypothetical protein
MFFLLRTAFWLCVVLALLPSLVPTQTPPAPSADVGAADAVTAASATVADLRGFCERRPDACAAGSQLAVAFAQRAQAGAKIVFDFVADRLVKTEHPANRAGAVAPAVANGEAPRGDAAKDAAKPGQQNPSSHKAPSAAATQSTLTDADMVPPWRGPQPHKDAPPRRPPAQAAL